MRIMDVLALSKKYTQKTIEGSGAIKGKDGFSPVVQVVDTEKGHLVTITDATGAHSFEVKDGQAGGEAYNGEYKITPKAFESQSLATAQKIMEENIEIAAVPYSETPNASDGITVRIADGSQTR